jgi:hypothetical protein
MYVELSTLYRPMLWVHLYTTVKCGSCARSTRCWELADCLQCLFSSLACMPILDMTASFNLNSDSAAMPAG